MALTKRQIAQHMLFAMEYVKDFNGTRAAERAGYKGSEASLGVQASRVLRYARVQEKIADLLSANAMQASEALWRLAGQARNDISMFVIEGEDGFEINWLNIRKFGYLVKSISHTRQGPKIVLHDSQRALELIGKHFAIFTDKVQHSWQDTLPDSTSQNDAVNEFKRIMDEARSKAKVEE